MNERMTVDIIIPTYNPDDKFKKLMQRLQRQNYPIHQIHVINTESGAFPEEFCRNYDNVEVTHISSDAFDHGATRDMGAASSGADIVIYMTQDAVPINSKLVEELVKPFEDESIGAVYARQLPNRECDVIERYTRSFNYPKESRVKTKDELPEMGIKTFFCSNVCAAYRKKIYDEMGGFVKHTIFNEDMIMAGRMIQSEYKVVYCASAEVVHSHNYGCIEQFKRNFDLAVSQKDHPEIFSDIKSENEGIKLVKHTIKYLIRIKKPWLVFSLIVKSAFKYAGYKMGMHYKKLPQQITIKCSMNPKYWLA